VGSYLSDNYDLCNRLFGYEGQVSPMLYHDNQNHKRRSSGCFDKVIWGIFILVMVTLAFGVWLSFSPYAHMRL
jgi:hypothetical protein